jgi:hypothetical protein
VVLASAAGIFAIREGDWKLIERNESLPGSRGWRSKAEAENQDQLFHLLEDPGEKQNLWAQRPEIAKRLTGLLARARAADRTRPGTRGAASGPPGAAQ